MLSMLVTWISQVHVGLLKKKTRIHIQMGYLISITCQLKEDAEKWVDYDLLGSTILS